MIDTSPSLFVHNHRTVDGSTIRYQTANICSPKNIDHGCHTLLDSEAPPTCCWKSLCWRPHNGRIEVFFRPSLTVLLLSGLLPMVILFFFYVHLLTNHSRHIFQSSVCCVRIRFLASHRSDIVCVCQDLFLTTGYGSLSACGTLGLVAFVVFVHRCNV